MQGCVPIVGTWWGHQWGQVFKLIYKENSNCPHCPHQKVVFLEGEHAPLLSLKGKGEKFDSRYTCCDFSGDSGDSGDTREKLA